MNKEFMGLNIETKHAPPLDAGFLPLAKVLEAYENSTAKGIKVGIAVERPDGSNRFVYRIGNPVHLSDLDKYMARRILAGMLWFYGGRKVYVSGSYALHDYLKDLASDHLNFDYDFMANVYEGEFEFHFVPMSELPEDVCKLDSKISTDGKGCIIGFDAGGSDMKVSAVVDGEAVFSEEIVWHPKITEDPKYHYDNIVSAMKLAASKMDRVDGVGVSSAGVYVQNRTMAASLFLKVPKELFDEHVKDIYPKAAANFGDVPLVVANDGDVTALAGAMELGVGRVFGIAMGTSQAGGYINESGGIMGWLNELAFVPVDANPDAAYDEWSRDIGRGVLYFSQDAVIKLAPAAGITLDAGLSPAEKLLVVQNAMIDGHENQPGAKDIYKSIGIYLGYSIAYYSRFYDINHILLLGRVMSGDGGLLILENARIVLRDEYPELAEKITLHLPDEAQRRVGQSVAAAALV
ncbi:MAG: ROK family protein [Defluviitaleaceae bacterium]|nr:ROK family protein [Defluviitaleaceae bacterium]